MCRRARTRHAPTTTRGAASSAACTRRRCRRQVGRSGRGPHRAAHPQPPSERWFCLRRSTRSHLCHGRPAVRCCRPRAPRRPRVAEPNTRSSAHSSPYRQSPRSQQDQHSRERGDVRGLYEGWRKCGRQTDRRHEAEQKSKPQRRVGHVHRNREVEADAERPEPQRQHRDQRRSASYSRTHNTAA